LCNSSTELKSPTWKRDESAAAHDWCCPFVRVLGDLAILPPGAPGYQGPVAADTSQRQQGRPAEILWHVVRAKCERKLAASTVGTPALQFMMEARRLVAKLSWAFALEV
jgi:hypothetical protein